MQQNARIEINSEQQPTKALYLKEKK